MINIETNIEEQISLKVEYDDLFVESEWHSAIFFGVSYFFEHYSRKENKGLYVSVKKIHTMLEDTSYMVVMYATVKCLCEMLNFPQELISINQENGLFTLIK
jgi:hypothetical protein